jgi:hypothetical protein
MTQFVYQFKEAGDSKAPRAQKVALFGGKGANLAEMTALGMPVPQGFTITTEACTQYYKDGEKINESIQAEIMKNISALETLAGKQFGSLDNPLLVSVRSGARASMPGMMDTILNLGLNDEVAAGMIAGNADPADILPGVVTEGWTWDPIDGGLEEIITDGNGVRHNGASPAGTVLNSAVVLQQTLWFAQQNSLLKRLGDLRLSPAAAPASAAGRRGHRR